METYKKITKKSESWRKKNAEQKRWKESKLIAKALKNLKREECLVSQPQSDHKTVKESEPSSSGRTYTVSIALPGSILDNAQSAELRTYLAGQIARAAVVFQIDEIVVFDEHCSLTQSQFEKLLSDPSSSWLDSNEGRKFRCNSQLMKILQFLECPQYLRKHLFSLHKDLQYAGLLNPLDCLHHFRSDDLSVPYREGVVLHKPTKSGIGSYCNAGLSRDVAVDQSVEPGVRVTLKLNLTTNPAQSKQRYKGQIVSPSEPTRKFGHYWGYNVRLARSISAVFDECPYIHGYDLTVGTSEKGTGFGEVDHFPTFRHLLLVFGGVKGLESCVENDQSITNDDPANLFNYYLNTCPDQGSRTIRTEEAILITLSALRSRIQRAGIFE